MLVIRLVVQWLVSHSESASRHIMNRDLRIGNFRSNQIGDYDSNRISNRIRGSRLHVQCQLSCESCVCALATAVQLHVKWSVNIYLNYKRCKGWCLCWTVSERSLWYDSTQHVLLIRNFQISMSLLNLIRIGMSDSNWISEVSQVPNYEHDKQFLLVIIQSYRLHLVLLPYIQFCP